MNRKPLVAGVVVSLLVLGAFELLLATTHPSREMGTHAPAHPEPVDGPRAKWAPARPLTPSLSRGRA